MVMTMPESQAPGNFQPAGVDGSKGRDRNQPRCKPSKRNMPTAIASDESGTLINTAGILVALKGLIGERAELFSTPGNLRSMGESTGADSR
jgi:hypothetical protein